MVNSNSTTTKTDKRFLSVNVFFVLLGLCLIAISVILWKNQESRNLSQLYSSTEANARYFSSETEIRFKRIYNSLDRLASRELPLTEADTAEWEKDAAFYIDTYPGLKSVSWVGETLLIEHIFPLQENISYLNQNASVLNGGPAEVNLWLPLYSENEFKGYIIGIIDISDFISPAGSEIKNDYMLQLSNEGTTIFKSEAWTNSQEEFVVKRNISLHHTAILHLSFAPTVELYNSEIAHAKNTLAYSLFFSFITEIAVYFAYNFKVQTKINETQYYRTLENLNAGYQLIGYDWRYIIVNDSAAKQSPLSKEELLGHTIMECYPGIEKTDLFSTMKLCMDERTPQIVLDSFKFSNGSTGWHELNIQPAPDGIIVLSNDVTEKRRAEIEVLKLNTELEERIHKRTAELQKRVKEIELLNAGMLNIMNDLQVSNLTLTQAQKELEQTNQELESFSYSVSHDLRAPLRHIISFSKLLEDQEKEDLDQKSRGYLDNIMSSTQKMGRLIDDLLAFSQIGKKVIQLREVDPNAIIEEVLQELEQDIEGRQIKWEVAPLPEVRADPRLLRIVWDNLLSNAVKFTKTRAEAKIKIGTQTPSEDEKDSIIFYVRDNGVGFEMAYVDKIFGVFQRLHSEEEFEGTGIGLATVRRLINRHGGRVWAEGKVDEGAALYFTLPRAGE